MANSFKEVSKQADSNVYSVSDMKYIDINDWNALGKNDDGSYSALTISSRDSGNKTVTLSGTPSQSTFRLYRATTSSPLVDFADGARLSASDLDTAYQQGLFAAQEVIENASTGLSNPNTVTNIANSQLAGGISNDKLAGSITADKLAGSLGGTLLSDDTVTYAKIQNVSANSNAILLGRSSTDAGNIEELVVDSDLTSVSDNHDTVASAKGVTSFVQGYRPKYIAISGTSGSTAIVQATGGTNVGGSTATFTYTLSELTGGTGLDSTKFNVIYVMCKCDVKQFSGDGTTATATIEATFPDGTVHKIMDLQSPSAEDDRQILEQVIQIPINKDQTTLVLTHTVAGSTSSGATHKCDTNILGASQLESE